MVEQLATAPPLPALLRAARHLADLSQRELAAASGISARAIASIESGVTRAPAWSTIARLLAAARCRLQIVDADGRPLQPLAYEDALDRGQRHWPAHLDTRCVRHDRDLRSRDRDRRPRPTHTYERDRAARDVQRWLERRPRRPRLTQVDFPVTVVADRDDGRVYAVLTPAQRALLGPGSRVVADVGCGEWTARVTVLPRRVAWRVPFVRWCFPVDAALRPPGDEPRVVRLRVAAAVTPPEVPPDLDRAFVEQPAARAAFGRLPAVQRRDCLDWVADARTAATRRHRVRCLVTFLLRPGTGHADTPTSLRAS